MTVTIEELAKDMYDTFCRATAKERMIVHWVDLLVHIKSAWKEVAMIANRAKVQL